MLLRGTPPSGSGDGYGSGYGSGDGDGSGYGYGSGYGSGDGDGSGYGYGYGSGYGSGYGYGSGDGDGSGYGSGDGSGYGYGSGDGDGEYWAACVAAYSERWSGDANSRLKKLQSEGATIAYWKSDAEGRACNGGRNDPVKPGTVETSAGPLELCGRGTLHATHLPHKWEGARMWVVALIGDVVGDGEKFGALMREVIAEVE